MSPTKTVTAARAPSVTERKKMLRFRTKDQILKFHWLEDYCATHQLNPSRYMVAIICGKIEELMVEHSTPDLVNRIFATTRTAVFAGTKGQNIFMATLTKPVIQSLEVLNLKVNLVLNYLTGQIGAADWPDFQRPPDAFLDEPVRFQEIRAIIDQNADRFIKSYIYKHKNKELNAQDLAKILTFSEGLHQEFAPFEPTAAAAQEEADVIPPKKA